MSTQKDIKYPIATVDAVIFTIDDDQLKLLLHKRPQEPFQGAWALPGGFIHVDKDADLGAAMHRVLTTKVGATGFYIEQLQTYSGPDRDPRGWSLSVTHLALVPRGRLVYDDDVEVLLAPVDNLPSLAFDHGRILTDALSRLRGKGSYSTLPVSFLAEEFTLAEMLRVYEIVLNTTLDRSSFRRKVSELGLVEETGEARSGVRTRPAKLYRLRDNISTFDRTLGQGLG